MNGDLPAAPPERQRRAPLLQLSHDSLRVVVPLKRTRDRLIRGGLLLLVGGVAALRVLLALVLSLMSGAMPIAALMAMLVALAINIWGLPFLVLGAYTLWGAHIVSVAEGHAALRFELWGEGYRHARLYVGRGAKVEVVPEPSGAHVRVSGFRTGAGLRPASFSFGYGSLTQPEAVQIADRISQVIRSSEAAGSNKRVERTPSALD